MPALDVKHAKYCLPKGIVPPPAHLTLNFNKITGIGHRLAEKEEKEGFSEGAAELESPLEGHLVGVGQGPAYGNACRQAGHMQIPTVQEALQV